MESKSLRGVLSFCDPRRLFSDRAAEGDQRTGNGPSFRIHLFCPVVGRSRASCFGGVFEAFRDPTRPSIDGHGEIH